MDVLTKENVKWSNKKVIKVKMDIHKMKSKCEHSDKKGVDVKYTYVCWVLR